ncbi:Hypothetical predicted protein [Pelobates cultripes]|uniref:Uncharacterized protein n=1 Tax=Pelobates cultripes TaxID=61616 RepID=A0AAD1RES0_PELCU|nr:Hypothetical predicted protein [Pelobates cultripes]
MDLEEERGVLQAQITNISSTIDSHLLHFAATQRHIDDLDNRGRRNNLRIRGLPETQGEDLTLVLTELLNLILGVPSYNPIIFDRAHRSLRPRGLSPEALRIS